MIIVKEGEILFPKFEGSLIYEQVLYHKVIVYIARN